MNKSRITSATVGTIAGAIVAAAGIALVQPVDAAPKFDAKNAKRVGGLTAKQLNRSAYFAQEVTFDDFDTCSFTTVLSKKFKAPTTGYLTVNSSVAAARDTDDPNEGILTTRILIDNKVASLPASVNLENDGVLDANSNNIGSRKVKKGKRTVKVQMQECGPGRAFVTSQAATVQFSPFGSASAPVAKIAARRSTNVNR
jgi:hypothetical protein